MFFCFPTLCFTGCSTTSHSMLADLQNTVGARIRDKWYTFGVQVGVPTDHLESLKESQLSAKDRFTRVFIYWEKNEPHTYAYSWKTVV